MCHHCKQRKPLEVLTKCKASDNAKLEAPSKHFVVNNTTIFRSKVKFIFLFFLENKNFVITNYMGDPREILENYLMKSSNFFKNIFLKIFFLECQYICNRYYCNLCLKGSYDWNLEILKDKNNWMCPCCMVY